MKQVAGQLRLDLASYRELAAFAQFGSDLEKATQARLNRGQKTMEILKQGQYEPMPVEEQVLVIFAATKGYIDDIPLERIKEFEQEFLRFMRTVKAHIPEKIRTAKALSDELMQEIGAAINEFKQGFLA
jgi:F-type H+-transporting ATPase subunit alpha